MQQWMPGTCPFRADLANNAIKRNQSNGRHGFSLIELLVAIAVLFVLIGIMLPALHHAVRGSARLIQCSNNLYQLQHALAGYLHDHKDQLPEANYHPLTKHNGMTPLNETLYGNNEPAFNIWICPADPDRVQRFNGKRSSYVYPPSKLFGIDNANFVVTDQIYSRIMLLADHKAYHKPRFRPEDKVYIPKPMSGGSSIWNYKFDYPMGHNRLRGDGQITIDGPAEEQKAKVRR